MIEADEPTTETYLKLWKDAMHTGNAVVTEAKKYFKRELTDEQRNFIDQLALRTQICIKASKLMYVHGHVLYLAIRDYLQRHNDIKHINILETGTARGFSAVCMSKALSDANRSGTITTYDILPHEKMMKWNCIVDFEDSCVGQTNRIKILKPWENLTDNIRFLVADTRKGLHSDDHSRIHFAFLDAQHDYKHLSHELNYTMNRQQHGDVIVCDDYTKYHKENIGINGVKGPYQYPGIIKAVDEFIKKGIYDHKIFYADDGTKKRGYVYLVHR